MAKTIESTVLITLGPGMEAPAGTLYATGDDLSFRYDSTYTISSDSFDLFPSMPRSLAPFFFSGLGPFFRIPPQTVGAERCFPAVLNGRVSASRNICSASTI